MVAAARATACPAVVLILGGGDRSFRVSALLQRAKDPSALIVLGHGAGAPMTHPFMQDLSQALARHGLSVLRFNFAYAEAGRRRPDPPSRLLAVAEAALERGFAEADGLPLFGGGKSMGGRMISTLLAGEPSRRAGPAGVSSLPVTGLVFFGFPLHPPGRPGVERADHLARVRCPMLFHQGDRDRLAKLELVRAVTQELGDRAELRVVDGADHSFNLPKRARRPVAEVLDELARATALWAGRAGAQ